MSNSSNSKRLKEPSLILTPTSTTIILQGLPWFLTSDMLLVELERMVGRGGYIFVHLPFSETQEINAGFALIDLASPAVARKCFNSFKGKVFYDGLCSAEVFPAEWHVQGMAANLAFFIARYGFNRLQRSDRPLLFQRNGLQIQEIFDVVDSLVSLELCESMEDLLRELESNNPLPGLGRTELLSRSEQLPAPGAHQSCTPWDAKGLSIESNSQHSRADSFPEGQQHTAGKSLRRNHMTEHFLSGQQVKSHQHRSSTSSFLGSNGRSLASTISPSTCGLRGNRLSHARRQVSLRDAAAMI